ncbi:MAG: DNA-3-methyladenine glycosylase I [Bacteroidota bacterium]
MQDGKIRCSWASEVNQAYIDYHDNEWGVPVHDDRVLFEFLILEGAQAGLSWATILNRRSGYRKAFADFQPEIVASYSAAEVETLLQDPGIIRNKLKVNGAVKNAQLFLDIQEEFGSFDAYIWRFVDGSPIINHWENMSQVPVTTPESDAMSKDLKKRGFKFVGSTIMYAYMQACGLVMDHTVDCFRYAELKS